MNLSNEICLEGLLFMADCNRCLGAIRAFQEAFLEASISVGAPHGLLGVIGFCLMEEKLRKKYILLTYHSLPFHLHGDDQVRTGVGVRFPCLSQFDVARHLALTRSLFLSRECHVGGGGMVISRSAAWSTSFWEI